MSLPLTPEELSEIALFARTHPEWGKEMLAFKDPRTLLEAIREQVKEENENVN